MKSKKMILSAAAMSGLFAGALICAAATSQGISQNTNDQQNRITSQAGAKAAHMDAPTSQNDCKGKGCCKA